MMVDALVQIQANYKAKQEDEYRNGRRDLTKFLSQHMMSTETIKAGSNKLRTSKWFEHSEISIVTSVLENGFIVERKHETRDDLFRTYGIAMWNEGYEKSRDPVHLKIYTVVNRRVRELKFLEFWIMQTRIKISNSGDRNLRVNDVASVRWQLERAKQMKFDREEHFVCFCRYFKPKKTSYSCCNFNMILSRFRAFSVRW